MKQVKVTILVDIDQDNYESAILAGDDDKVVCNNIRQIFNSANLYYHLVSDFEVASVEVKV